MNLESCFGLKIFQLPTEAQQQKMKTLDAILQAIYNQGTNDCYCCSNPSMCLTGGFSVVTAILRNVGMVGTGFCHFLVEIKVFKNIVMS